MKRLRILIIAAFILNLILKSFLISSIPPLLTDDEMYYATEAQSILAGGTDITGKWRPWHLAPANPIYSELTGLTYAPGFLLFPNNTQVAMKVVPVVFGSLLPILLGLIVYKLFARKLFFVSTVLIATLNPWIYQFSRMSFDSLASVFFYCLGIVGMLYLRGWKMLIALIPFALGFFQYQGHKPLLVPLVFLTLLYTVLSKNDVHSIMRKPKHVLARYKVQIFILLGCALLTGAYLIRLPSQSASTRISEFVVDKEKLAQQVDMDRRLSLSNPFKPLFTNKGIELVSQFTHRFVAVFDLKWLFVEGNNHVDTFAVTTFGFLYVLDALLILITLIAIWSQSRLRSVAVFLSLFVLIGTLPNVIKQEALWLTFRGSFMILGLVLFAGIGAALVWQKSYRVVALVFVSLYMCGVLAFFYDYLVRYPVLATKNLSFYHRVVASYIQRQSSQSFQLHGSKQLFESILAYNHAITDQTLPQLHQAYATNTYELGNIQMMTDCFEPKQAASQSATVLVDFRSPFCEGADGPSIATPSGEIDYIAISSKIDGLRHFYIYNDQLCKEKGLSEHLAVGRNTFAVEDLSDEEFCKAFFVQGN